jgi:hypothetical protein
MVTKSEKSQCVQRLSLMKTASLGLLEVKVRALPGEGDVTASPCFRRELRILLSSIFGEKNPFGFAAFSRSDVEDLLRGVETLFLAGGHNALTRRQLLWSFAGVKVWPLQGPNPHKFHL